jgi:hypothetical protein
MSDIGSIARRTQISIRFVGFNRESAKKTDFTESVFLCLLLLMTRLEYSLPIFPILHRNFQGTSNHLEHYCCYWAGLQALFMLLLDRKMEEQSRIFRQ